jgi:hypothetical protein
MKNLIIILIICIASFSCKKNELGGKSTVEGTVFHHSKAIANARVFIKYNATEFPGSDTTAYDEKVTADANGKYSLKVYKGKYYLYGYGIDLQVPPPYHVVGGVPVKIRNNEKIKIDLAVTEGD